MKNRSEKKRLDGNSFLLAVTIILFFVMYIAGIIMFGGRGFAKVQNFLNLFISNAGLIVVATGMTIVMITGGIDISVGSVVAMVCMMLAWMMERGNIGAFPAILIVLATGCIFGLVQGFLVAYLKIQPFIVTLATMNVAKGLAYVYTGGSPVRVVTKEWQFLGAGYVGGVPTPVILLAVVLVITAIIMNKTKLGRHMRWAATPRQPDSQASAQPRLNSWYIPIQESWRDLRAWFWPPVCIPASRRQETEPRWTPLRLLWWAAPPWQAAPVKSEAPS